MDESRTWDAMAGRYDRIVRLFDRSYPAIRARLRAELAGAERVIELAAGTGQFTRALAAAAHHVLATDVSPEMVARLTAAVTGAGVDNVEFTTMSAYQLEVDDHSFDAALCANALHVMEEPARALADGMLPCTVVAGRPTPVLIAGAPRRCVVATDIDPARGRPLGLYGRRFARASPEVVRMATTRLEPPTRSNILAMEAPACLRGVYTEEQLHHILETAITGFSAARAVSGELAPGRATMIHTGYWGCGAYGGDRTLMAMLQLVAAATSGIERVVFHVVDRQGRETFARASAALDTLAGELAPAPMSEMIACLAAMGFRWGVSDGN